MAGIKRAKGSTTSQRVIKAPTTTTKSSKAREISMFKSSKTQKAKTQQDPIFQAVSSGPSRAEFEKVLSGKAK